MPDATDRSGVERGRGEAVPFPASESGGHPAQPRSVSGVLKRFVLFSGEWYYPSGGWNDFADSFDSLEEAQAAAPSERYTWWHVIDLETRREVESGQS